MSITPQQGIIDSVDGPNGYNAFGKEHIIPDTKSLNDKLEEWLQDVKDKKKDPSILLEIFFTEIMTSDGDGSVTRQDEDKLSKFAKEDNYLSAYRNVISDIKGYLTHHSTDPGDVDKIRVDIKTMEQYRGADAFYDKQQILQNSDGTFTNAEVNIGSILDKIGPGKTYSSFDDLFKEAQQPSDPNKPNSATNDFQTFSNNCDTLLSAVGVQNNVVQTQMQDTQSDIKTEYSVVSQAVEAVLKLLGYTVQRQMSN